MASSTKPAEGMRFGVPDLSTLRSVTNYEALKIILLRRALREEGKQHFNSSDTAENTRNKEIWWLEKQVSKYLLKGPAAYQTREQIQSVLSALDTRGKGVGAGLGLTPSQKQQIIDLRTTNQLQLFLVLASTPVPVPEETYERMGSTIAELLPSRMVPGCPAEFVKLHFEQPKAEFQHGKDREKDDAALVVEKAAVTKGTEHSSSDSKAESVAAVDNTGKLSSSETATTSAPHSSDTVARTEADAAEVGDADEKAAAGAKRGRRRTVSDVAESNNNGRTAAKKSRK